MDEYFPPEIDDLVTRTYPTMQDEDYLGWPALGRESYPLDHHAGLE